MITYNFKKTMTFNIDSITVLLVDRTVIESDLESLWLLLVRQR